jgi:hypothetical protein
MPVTVATWYMTIIPPRTAAGADSATKIGAVTIDRPIVTPSRKRAPSSQSRLGATPLRTANSAYVSATSIIVGLRPSALARRLAASAPAIDPATTIVATHSVCFVLRSKSSVMKSSAPEMLPRS